MEVVLGPGRIRSMGTQLPLPKKGQSPPFFGQRLLWPKGCMDQNATWYDGRLPPGNIVRCGPSSSKGHSPKNFGPCLLWPNGWMDQDATLYEGRPRPRPHCITWGPSSPQKEHSPPIFGPCLFWSNSCPSRLLLSTCLYSYRCGLPPFWVHIG